jgi:hypothetical protein
MDNETEDNKPNRDMRPRDQFTVEMTATAGEKRAG